MSRATPPSSIPLPPPPTASQLAGSSSAVDDSATPSGSPLKIPKQTHLSVGKGRPGRISFSTNTNPASRGRRPSAASSHHHFSRRVSTATTTGFGEGEGGDDEEFKPVVPSLFAGAIRKQEDQTPLPVLPMIVLGIAMMGEWLSANVSAPFILAMVKSFGVEKHSVGVWTGNLVSAFFLTQFFTSLLWSTIADKHGRRAVLFVTLLGNALTVILFGTARSLPEAIAIRLAQGIFNGGIGVVRGGIRGITDHTNEAKAYALLGFVWGFGGVVGPVIGGLAESPAKNYPDSAIGQMQLFISFPYLLPCLLASSFLFVGAFLSLFLDVDGGSRSPAIALPIEKTDTTGHLISSSDAEAQQQQHDESSPLNGGLSHKRSATFGRRVSGFLANRVFGNDDGPTSRSSFGSTHALATGVDSVRSPGEASVRTERSRRNQQGSSAYGYGRKSFSSARRGSNATARMDRGEAGGLEPEVEEEIFGHGRVGTFFESVLMANEGLGGNQLNDLWVAQALAQEESVFDSDDEEVDDELAGDYDEDMEGLNEGAVSESADSSAAPTPSPSSPLNPQYRSRGNSIASTQQHLAPPGSSSRRFSRNQLGVLSPSGGYAQDPSSSGGRVFSSARNVSSASGTAALAFRRASNMSTRPMSLFAHTGLQSPTADLVSPRGGEQDPFNFTSVAQPAATSGGGGLNPIREGHIASRDASPGAVEAGGPKPASAIWKLPLFLIFQYFLLAIHDTSNGQLFLSFLNTEYEGGGLGLSPSHFSTLIAIMCFFQLFYQFVVYPRLGPPLGPFSHIQMFRLGVMLFIPAYLTTPMLRAFSSPTEDGSPFLMTLLTINMATRYAGGTLTYTAIMVLVNAMSPPEVINLSNGLAQSCVSLARVCGPILGGLLWTESITPSPAGYAFGFNVVALVCSAALLSSFLLR